MRAQSLRRSQFCLRHKKLQGNCRRFSILSDEFDPIYLSDRSTPMQLNTCFRKSWHSFFTDLQSQFS